MKKIILASTITLAVIASSSVQAAVEDRFNVKLDNKNLSSVMSLDSNYSFDATKRMTTKAGTIKERQQQMYKGIPVYGHTVVIEKNGINMKISATGNIAKSIGNDLDSVKAVVFPAEATFLLKDAFNHRSETPLKSHVINGKFENIQNVLMILISENKQSQLVYKSSYFIDDNGRPSRPTAFIDASTGEIIKSWDNLQTKGKPGGNNGSANRVAAHATGPGGNGNTGLYLYGSDFPLIDVMCDGIDCIMDSANVQTRNLKNKTRGGNIFSFTGPENTYQTTNGAFSPINDAQFFGNVIFNMYNDWYNTAPLTFKLEMRVHYGRNYENAFWNGSAMSFGDGASYFYPLVSLDVSAHEVSHGFTEQNSNLAYSGQTGGINESFSDMAGEAAEYYMLGNNDFEVGAEIIKNGSSLRSMSNPPSDGRSIDNAGDYTSGMDVHYSSGVFNKAFYLLATTGGWNTKTAFDVYVRANQLYWNSSTNYNSAACGVESAASDLGYNVSAVSASLAAVGVSCQ